VGTAHKTSNRNVEKNGQFRSLRRKGRIIFMWILRKPFTYPSLIFLFSELVNFERNLLLQLLTPQAYINYFAL
jgi:hypothetical protein